MAKDDFHDMDEALNAFDMLESALSDDSKHLKERVQGADARRIVIFGRMHKTIDDRHKKMDRLEDRLKQLESRTNATKGDEKMGEDGGGNSTQSSQSQTPRSSEIADSGKGQT